MRPERVTHEPVPVGEARPMDTFPARYSHGLERNQLLELCCRRMENLTGATFKTDPDLDAPDLFIATCSCGRKHYRVAAGEQ